MNFKTDISTQDCLTRIHETLQSHELFYGHGTDNAWDEACWLLDAVLKRNASEEGSATVLSSERLRQIDEILQRRVEEKIPLAYLLNEAWFAGIPFYVDERVLIPRSPIAELIQNRFEPLLEDPPRRILDLCTGSGCIGIACALAFQEARVDLTDISPGALAVAGINIEKHQLQERVRAFESDVFANVADRYDLIVSNPPYVSTEEYAGLPREYRREPRAGLVCEDEGLAIPLRILRESANHLHPGGLLVMEVGNSWEALDQALPQVPFLWLDFEHGGHGVCALKREQLAALK